MDDPDYVADPKDFKEINFNIKLLVQKFNHEHSISVGEIKKTKKDVAILKKDVNEIKTGFKAFSDNIKGMSTMLKILMGIITVVGVVISVGAIVSGFN